MRKLFRERCYMLSIGLSMEWRNSTMARLARAELFAPDEVAMVHVMNRVVRRCFLL